MGYFLFLMLGPILLFLPFVFLLLTGMSLWTYISAKMKNKKEPGTFSKDAIREKRASLIAWTLSTLGLTAILIYVIYLLSRPIAFMLGGHMKSFSLLLFTVLAVCLALTIAHIIYAAYAYEHCSIIYFVGKELW